MSITTPSARRLGRASNSHNDRRHRADFARQAVIAAFGYKAAIILGSEGFADRRPDQAPRRINGRPTEGLA